MAKATKKVAPATPLLDMDEVELRDWREAKQEDGWSEEQMRAAIVDAAIVRERDRLRALSVDGDEGMTVLADEELLSTDVKVTDGWVPTSGWRPEVFANIKETRRAIEKRVVAAERARAALKGGIRMKELTEKVETIERIATEQD